MSSNVMSREPVLGTRFPYVVAVAAVLLAAPLSAQSRSQGASASRTHDVSVAPEIGVAIPAARLADVEKAGASVGLHLSYRLGPRLAIDADGGMDALRGATLSQGVKAPDTQLWRYTAGLEGELLPMGSRRWSLLADVGAGATTFWSEKFTSAGAVSTDFRHTYPMVGGGLQLGYELSPRMTLFADGQVDWTSVDESDTRALEDLDPARLRTFASAWTFPIAVGFRAQL